MKDYTHIIVDHVIQTDHQAISVEQVIKRKIMRRRRVAKRMLYRFPLFAVEEMQHEFPGYTYEEWEADVLRKTRRGKSFRRPKPKAFDWKTIREKIPEFFIKCVKRTKSKAVLFGHTKTGEKFTCIVRSYWNDESGERKLRTEELIKLWQGPLRAFLSHPAVQLFEHQNSIIP